MRSALALLLVLVLAVLCGLVLGDTIFSFGNFGEDSSPIYYWNPFFRIWLPYNHSDGHHYRYFDSWTEGYFWIVDSAGTLYDAVTHTVVASMPADLTGQVFTTSEGFMLGNFSSNSQPEYRGIASFSFSGDSGSITPMGSGLPEGIFVHAKDQINSTSIIATSGSDTALWAHSTGSSTWQPISEFTSSTNEMNRAYVIFSSYLYDGMYVGGSFKTTSGYRDMVMVDYITGEVSPVFSGNVGLNSGGSIRCMCSFFDDKESFYVAGDFTMIGGVAATGIAKYTIATKQFSAVQDGEWKNNNNNNNNRNGDGDDGENPFVVNTCHTMSDHILFGGSFTRAAGVAATNVFVLLKNGAVIRPMGLNSVPGEVYSFNTMAAYPGAFKPILEFLALIFSISITVLLCCCLCCCVLIVIVGVAYCLRAYWKNSPILAHYYQPVRAPDAAAAE